MKVIKAVLITFGIMCCLYGGLVLLAISGSHWFNYAGFMVGGVLIAAGVWMVPRA